MNFLGDHFFTFFFLIFFIFLLELFFIGFQTFVDIFGLVQFFSTEVSLKEGCFEFVAELDLFVFDHGAIFLITGKILIAIDSSIMLSPAILIPF